MSLRFDRSQHPLRRLKAYSTTRSGDDNSTVSQLLALKKIGRGMYVGTASGEPGLDLSLRVLNSYFSIRIAA